MICLEPRHELGFWLSTGKSDPQNTKGETMSNTISVFGQTLHLDPRPFGGYVATDAEDGSVVGWFKPKSFGCWTFTKNNGERMEGPTRYTMAEAMTAGAQRAHMIASKRSRNTTAEHLTIRETSDGGTVNHAVGGSKKP